MLNHCQVQLLKQKRLLHTVYNFYPHVRCQEQQNQACYLTKTILKNELPPSNINISVEERENIIESIKRCIIETNYFHRDKEVKPNRHVRPNRKIRMMEDFRCNLSMQVLLNMLKVVWSTESFRDLSCSTSLTYRTDLRAPWVRLGNNIQVCGKHGHLISGKRLLPLFADAEEIQKTNDEALSWDDIISPFFDLHPTMSDFHLNRGFYDDSPYPCPQTLLIVNPRWWKSRFNSGQAVFYSFAHAMTYALSQGEQMGTDLKNPIPVQCVVFNGVTLYYVCYQLNTLNFCDDNRGIKNMAWIVSDDRLYDQVTEYPSESRDFIEYKTERVSLVDFNRKVLAQTFSNDRIIKVSIDGYNRNTVSTFTDFLLRS